MMEFAEQDAVGHHCFAVVPVPMLNVVSFRPGRWSRTDPVPEFIGPGASAELGSECDSLLFTEQALLPTHIQGLSVVGEAHFGSGSATDQPVHGLR